MGSSTRTRGTTRRTGASLLVPGGRSWMGSTGHYPEEAPVRTTEVADLWVDEHPVTTTEFRRFVADTGHVTSAELPPPPVPGEAPGEAEPGSLVFTPPDRPVPLDDWRRWWSWVPGASWRHPGGPGTDLTGRDKHPVTHVSDVDARAYAAWAGTRLPTEPEWEHAARGGVATTWPWGEELEPRGRPMANTFRGAFPWAHEDPQGAGTSPVGRYRPNGHGLVDVIGNVWEWTTSPWTEDHVDPGHPDEPGPSTAPDAPVTPAGSCCAPSAAAAAVAVEERWVIKGGSHLCAPAYCRRYRPSARQGQVSLTTTGHLGFRCVRDA